MNQIVARFPVLADARILSVVAAVVLAVVSVVLSGDLAAAHVNIGNGH